MANEQTSVRAGVGDARVDWIMNPKLKMRALENCIFAVCLFVVFLVEDGRMDSELLEVKLFE